MNQKAKVCLFPEKSRSGLGTAVVMQFSAGKQKLAFDDDEIPTWVFFVVRYCNNMYPLGYSSFHKESYSSMCELFKCHGYEVLANYFTSVSLLSFFVHVD